MNAANLDKEAISPPSDQMMLSHYQANPQQRESKPLIRVTEIPDPELEFDVMEDVFTNMQKFK